MTSLVVDVWLSCFVTLTSLLCVIILPVFCEPPETLKFYTDNGDHQTLAYSLLRSHQKRELQEDILNVLGLDHRPTPPVHEMEDSAPKFLLDLYQSVLDSDSGLIKWNGSPDAPVILEGETLSRSSLRAINASDKIISFGNQIHHLNLPSSSSLHDRRGHHRRLFFDVSEVSSEDEVMGCELRIYRSLADSYYPSNWTYTVSVYQIIDKGDHKSLRKLDSKKVGLHDNGWILFNVTKALLKWTFSGMTNHGLVVKVKHDDFVHDLMPKDIGLLGFSSGFSRDKNPFLLGFFQTTNGIAGSSSTSSSSSHVSKRKKRREQRSPRHREVSYYDDDDSWNPYENPAHRYVNGRSCQRKTLYVSFRDLGWQDWIIAPDGYAAFFCHGECSFPLSPHMNATNHAIVQTLVHLMYPNQVPKPCCAPTKLSSIMVLYFDDNANVILKKYRNMIVKSCGCH